ncbi:MFS transporter [Sphingobium sufflavum]|uniref:MFS transporter n=1 Tax=Sphingobium sufflavum TaxID=1129547 RepID=UPI001F433FA5|nr:MFS transporter [Sphingobium sufflavum]MCE7795642.1 MFS transporter [Sphingobium sufflavum]
MTAETVAPGVSDAPGALAEWRRGWPVVLAAGIGYGTGGAMILLMAGLFIKPMRDALGWSTSAVAIAPIVSLVWALCYPFSGWAIDRIGSRRAGIAGALGLAVCFAALGLLPISQTMLFTMAALLGVFASLTAVPTYTRAVASWFRRGVGLAFGITLSGSALVTIFATPFTGTMIAQHGWRAGFLTMAGITLLIGLPVILLFYRERTQDGAAGATAAGVTAAPVAAPISGATIGEALRDARFWLYFFAFAIACVPLGGFVGHLQPMLADKGFPLATALSLGVMYALSISFGKVVVGILLDRLWSFGVAAGVTMLAGLGAVGLASAGAGTPLPLIAAMLFVIGTGQGAEGDFVAYFALRSFGMRAFATIVGLLGMMSTVGLAIGAFLFSQIFDRTGSYVLACGIGAGCLLLSGVMLVATGVADRRRGAVRG